MIYRNKFFITALFIILIINISGCAELRRKFIRKKKPRKEEASFYRVEEYGLKPPHERYQDHYILWHNWHLDLLRAEATSHLRDIRAANEALRHLTEMRDLLVDEKAEELNVQVKQLEELAGRIKVKKIDIIKDLRSRKRAEKIERVIINMFTYNRMKDYIKHGNPQK
jgi:hypothetical protein